MYKYGQEFKNLKEEVFKKHSYDIFEFLEKADVARLSLTSNFFLDLYDNYFFVKDSFKMVLDMKDNEIELDKETEQIFDNEKPKKSKFSNLYTSLIIFI